MPHHHGRRLGCQIATDIFLLHATVETVAISDKSRSIRPVDVSQVRMRLTAHVVRGQGTFDDACSLLRQHRVCHHPLRC
jgi:hypothetical protein